VEWTDGIDLDGDLPRRDEHQSARDGRASRHVLEGEAALDELRSVHAGHHHVGDEQVDLRSVLFDDEQGFPGSWSLQDCVTVASQDGGSVTTLAPGPNTVAGGLSVDATSVYWTDSNAGTVMKMPLAGGTPTALASGLTCPNKTVVDATGVYWTDFCTGTVKKVPLAGGAVITLAQEASSDAEGIAVDATSIYWTNSYHSNQTPGTITRVPVGGGTTSTLVSLAPSGMPFGIAVDATSVYWTSNGNVMKAALDGGTPTMLASG
jgi:sugar lactone lactonase YvrE